MTGIEPATFGLRRNPRLHHRRSLCKDSVTCRHSIRAFFPSLERLHRQGKKQALKLCHRFPRAPRFYEFPRLGFRRLRKEPEIQLYLLLIACFSQVEPVVNSSRTQQGWSSFSTWSVVITNKTPVGAAKPFRTFSNPESVTPFWLGATSFVLSVAPLRAARI